jgi:hypothetical protein
MVIAIVAVLVELLAVAGALGALFGVVWWRSVKRYGLWMLLSAWLLSTLVIAGAGALRATVAARHVASGPGASWFPLNVFLLYAVALGLTLVPTVAALQWRVRQRPSSSFATILLSSAGWAMVGLLIMFVVVIRLAPILVGSRR